MLKIVLSPDPLLNQVSEPCDPQDRSLKRLARQMAKAMYANDGIGIAAPQVGVLKRLIVVECGTPEEPETMTLLNPEIVETDGEPVIAEEGCLSCPGVSVPIERKPWVRVRYLDLDGEAWEIESDGWFARCLQHEIDHLDGKTLFESASPRERIKALSAYAEAQKAGAKPGETSIDAKVR
ncbi:MAG: peptide deformylase [Eggerthellaceae bacterium]|nr:peptide deformylase [Eggerthellaceae bacterium]